MPFSSMAQTVISTKRAAPVDVNGKITNDPTTYLENVAALSPMNADTTLGGGGAGNEVSWRGGFPGQPIELMETYIESQSHTKSSIVVDETPDIREGDILVDGTIEYDVKFVAKWPLTSLTEFLRVVLEENKKTDG
jgi:hypothetical protein